MEAGSDIEMPSDFTPLMASAKNGRIETTKLLLQFGADYNASDNDNITSLAFAARNGHSEITKLLIDAGANINKQDNGGSTPSCFDTSPTAARALTPQVFSICSTSSAALARLCR